mmetsp:Transcript_5370/g.11792  ORF Transcript_5370/g.11792 Transcript_5370/m.11792 type:complete len:126 (-) Transcript_5370:340-717(-)|eukprot:CAMPEP_0202897854 /NCGR_PEP_ID=MMETSP1392-20130828/6519_1 /ASSEMBLY_ACC=CAM_ASM_000868 /TAXON_ID=225041 /ORGANISM="Chlamydomonas chlamydogama, Strain SAG 11-48b" /LENGTH=125 /DNA_ID=CAMNT_0049583615 /DNA_START=96 /DNA_END=473 /DNA_ORIENTATION=+
MLAINKCSDRVLGRQGQAKCLNPAARHAMQKQLSYTLPGQKSLIKQQSRVSRVNANSREEAEIEAMKRQASSGKDIWDSEVFSTIFKVIIVSGIVGVSILLFYVGQPVINNVVNSFPTASQLSEL